MYFDFKIAVETKYYYNKIESYYKPVKTGLSKGFTKSSVLFSRCSIYFFVWREKGF